MKHSRLSKILALLLVSIMLVGVIPVNAFAALYDGTNEFNKGSDYYNVISEKNWDIAPGVQETELVLNNEAGTRRQVLHTAIVDVNNPYVKVIPGTKGMWPKPGNYGTESTLTQALNAEKLGYGNVVVATNCSLSWYSEAYYKENPHLIGEPLGYSILDGQYYANSRIENGTLATGGVATIVVINYDYHPITGEPRPDDMPKTWIRSSTDPLTGWEQQAIPVLFTFLVKPDANGNPVNQYKENHSSDIASRTFVGVRADGSLVIAVSDGEQAPYSTGFTPYEMAEYMIEMGCIIAANCDGGGSTTFCSQRPGEDLKVNCSLADGGERPTSNTILVVSTAPADGVFSRATLSTDYDFYTPGATVPFKALGTDAVGTKVDIPADIEWAIKEPGMGTIADGVFTSNGTEGVVTAQMIYEGEVVGEKTITIATPDKLFFEQPTVIIPYGKTAKIPVKASASIDGVDFEIGLGNNDVTFTTTNNALGTFDGLSFTAVSEDLAPADITSTLTATLNMGSNPTATVQLNLGKGSEVLWDFEGGQADIDIWNVINNRKNAAHWDYYLNLSLADRTNGQVHDGDYSMRLETNGLSSKDSHSEQYAWIRLGVDGEAIVLENARSVGFWLYVPEDNIQCWVKGYYMTDSNGDGVFDTGNEVNMMESENVYYNVDESGWHYLSMDVSAFNKIALKDTTKYDKDPSDGMTGEKGEFFMAIVFHKAINNKLWETSGSINGNYTYYLDNFTVDYSDVVDDRENPVFDKVYLDGKTPLVKRDVVTTTNNVLNLSVNVADATTKLDADKNKVSLYNVSGLNADTAKAYIDGVEVKCTFDGSQITVNGVTVADGYHRVKFEICDNAGNKSVIIRVIKVESGKTSSTINVVPADPTLDRILFGSVYWMNLEATNIDTIQSVETVIDLNNVNHWQLDHMIVADGFSATYTIAEETNTATITITRTGLVPETGAAVLAQLPVRMLYFDTDIKVPGYTAQTYWTNYAFWGQDLKMDVDKGLITYTDGKTSTFSNEEFQVYTEMYSSMANMDKIYFAEHGTTHVHTAAPLEDKAPTCAQPGYTGRTYCDVCDSVVDWGTTIPAIGHDYKIDVANKTISCSCGTTYKGTGLVMIDGKGCYAVAGTPAYGWLTIDDEWYYFDEATLTSIESLNNGYVTFEFEASGKVKSGQWYHTSKGSRYYYGLGYYKGNVNGYKWVEIDGKNYCFNHYGYALKGINYAVDDYANLYEWHDFGTDGASRGKLDYTGIMYHNGNTYYLVDGCSRSGMFYADGAYYYAAFNGHYAAVKNSERNCYFKNNYGLLPVSTYLFGYDGKMVNNDVYNKNGVLYYYVMGKISQGDGTVEINGQQWTVESNGKVLFTGVTNDASGKYQYYENGVQIGTHTWDAGKITTSATCAQAGILTYTCADCNEVRTVATAMLAHVDNNGDYTCDICDAAIPHVHAFNSGVITTPATCTQDGVKTCTCTCSETMTAAITAPGHLDENGDLACDICGVVLEAKNGVVRDSDGNVRYYVNGVATRAGLVRDSQGNYYYINSTLKAVKNCTYSFNTASGNGLLPAGSYKFDAEGKMINPPAGEPIHVHAWGEGVETTPATCTENGVLSYICDCGLSKTETIASLGHADEDGNFACDRCGNGIVHDHVWDEGVVTTPAGCTTEGIKTYTCPCGDTKTESVAALDHVDDDNNSFCDRCSEPVAHIHVWDDGVVTTPATCTTEGVKTATCACGETKTEAIPTNDHIDEDGNFACDSCGNVVAHDHVWDNGVVTTPATCTEEGVKTYTCACKETKTETIQAIGKHIDENGNLSCDRCSATLTAKTGLVFDSDGNIRYYVNGVATRAGLVQDSQGNYYYINSTLKAVKNSGYSIGSSMTNDLLPAGRYQFDAEGKMIDPPTDEPTHKHSWDNGTVTTPAECDKTGVMTFVCGCGVSKTETIAALGHTDTDGNFACDTCGQSLPHSHVWDDGVITTPAGCTTEGTITYTCGCGETDTATIPALDHIDEDHNFACDRCGESITHIHSWNDGEITTEATCGTDGVKTYSCGCGETKTEVIAATGNHIDENGNLSCDRCSATLDAKTGLVFDSDGNIRYYVNGVATRAGLVQDSQGNYYYINSTLKAVKNSGYNIGASMTNGLLPAGRYQFAADGKMIID